MPDKARRFVLHRDEDISGVSGTGDVAEGIKFTDGTVAIRWRGRNASTSFWSTVEAARVVHGHGGSTRFVWLDS